MDCRNCGAPMTLVRDKDYFYCEYCASFCFPREDQDGLRLLDEAGGLLCPVCQADLVTASMDGARLLTCRHCRGILADQRVFALMATSLRTPSPTPGTARARSTARILSGGPAVPAAGSPWIRIPTTAPGASSSTSASPARSSGWIRGS